MKITQTNNQIELNNGGMGQLGVSAVLVVLGIIIAVGIFGGFVTNNGARISPLLGMIGVVLGITGVLVAFFAQKKRIVIVKGGDTAVTATRLIGGHSVSQSFPTASISSVRLYTYLEANNGSNSNQGSGVSFGNSNSNNTRRSELSLVLANNDVVELGSANAAASGLSVNGMNVSGLVQRAPLSHEAQQLAEFLGVPLDAQDGSNLATAVTSVVDAFKQATTTPSPTPPATPTRPEPPEQSPPPQSPSPPAA